MKLAIFGTSGGTGHALVEQALTAEHDITVLVRNPATFTLQQERLQILPGNVQNQTDVENTVMNNEAVLSALGTNQSGKVTVFTDGIRNIMKSMESHILQRLIVVSVYGVAESHHRNLYNFITWKSVREKMLDKESMEALIKSSKLDWTLVRPPRLTTGPKTGKYHAEGGLHMSIFSKISRANMADFMLKSLTDVSTFGKSFAITE